MTEQPIVKPYDDQQDGKKSQVSRMFDNIAPYYDLLNRVLSLGIDQSWRRKAIRKLQASKPQLILDIATGTADVAIETMKLLHPQKITGVDISAQMLDIGKDKIRKLGLDSRIELLQADSENLPFPDQSFDAATVAFGVRNFENLEKGLREILRVLKPGGKLIVLEFSKPRIFPFKQFYNGYFRYILPFIGKITSKDPKAYRYLYESVQAFPDADAFTAILEKSGFRSTEFEPLTLGICSIYTAIK